MSRRLGGYCSAPITMLRGEFNRKIKATYAEGKAEGMAQGALKTLDELEKQKGLFLGFDFEGWVAAKRAEAQKQEGKV